ncbi:MAG: S-layer homology domain-containing protein [bacterium]
MKKALLIMILISFCSISSYAAKTETFNDLPRSHWAAKAVYKLVDKGLTKGYPDNSFRGAMKVNRYDVASYFSKLLRYIELQKKVYLAKQEKIARELISQGAGERYIIENGNELKLHAKFVQRYRMVNPSFIDTSSPRPKGLRVDNRLILELSRKFDQESELFMTIDTMDAWFNTSTRRYLVYLFDAEAKTQFDIGWARPLDVSVLLGPGDVTHVYGTGDTLIPFENGVIYKRKSPSLYLSTTMGSARITSGYVLKDLDLTGTGEVIPRVELLTLDIRLGKIPLPWGGIIEMSDWARLYMGNAADYNSAKDLMAGTNILWKPHPQVGIGFDIAAGALEPDGWATNLTFNYFDPFNKGTNFQVRSQKVGSNFRGAVFKSVERSSIPYNEYSKNINDGTTDITAKVTQNIIGGYKAWYKFNRVFEDNMDYGSNYPLSNSTNQLGLDYTVNNNITLTTYYQVYNQPSLNPDTSEVAGLEWKVEF